MRMKAGIDFGTTLTKVAWRNADGTYGFHSTATEDDEGFECTPQELLVANLQREGVTRLRATGIGERWLKGFAVEEASGDPIEDEIQLQAEGVKPLLKACSGMTCVSPPPGSFLLVSVGTGVSYTRVVGAAATRFPYGNAIGGGFIAGLVRLLRLDYSYGIGEIDRLCAGKEPSDLLVRDVLVATRGTPMGEFVVAHFGKVSEGRPGFSEEKGEIGEWIASVLNCVAVSVIRDVMMMGLSDAHRAPGPLVIIGSTVTTFPALRRYLSRYAAMLGIDILFPDNGEFAAAVGALHAAEGT
jgi:pantothenate kinase